MQSHNDVNDSNKQKNNSSFTFFETIREERELRDLFVKFYQQELSKSQQRWWGSLAKSGFSKLSKPLKELTLVEIFENAIRGGKRTVMVMKSAPLEWLNLYGALNPAHSCRKTLFNAWFQAKINIENEENEKNEKLAMMNAMPKCPY